MPGMDGHALLRELRRRGHRFPAVLASGYSPAEPPDAPALRPYRRIDKPFSRAALLASIQAVRRDADDRARPAAITAR